MQILFNGLCNGALIALLAMAFVVVYLPTKVFSSSSRASMTAWRPKTYQYELVHTRERRMHERKPGKKPGIGQNCECSSQCV